ncbi:MAG: helix-turn-helix domain-containing protein [Firmicutes bacterium]|nr:helix-turn-helix domain-containing protein [Bacillota bacterium]
MEKFAIRLKELRNESGLSSKELGKLVGVSDASIIRWENNQSTVLAIHIINLAKFFDVSADYLLGLVDGYR